MSWIGLLDHERTLFCANGLARLCPDPNQAAEDLKHSVSDKALKRGSLVVETRVSPYSRPQTLLGVAPSAGGGLKLSLQAVPGGGVVMVINRGGQTCHAAVNLDTGGRADVLRITYSWDLVAERGRLTVEQPGTFRIAQRYLIGPVGVSLADIEACISKGDARVMASDLAFVAFSDRIEPIGPMPSLAMDTPVMTDRGYRAVGQLKRGDLVLASSGNVVPVLANVQRTVPAAGHFRPIRLRSPFFGLMQDIVTSPTQRLMIGGSRVEYMFGSEFVLVPSGHLLHGNAAMPSDGYPLVTYSQLMLPEHEAMLVAGTYLESLDIGRLRRKRELLKASLVASYPRARLPEHARTAYPVLREFEALTLAAQRAA